MSDEKQTNLAEVVADTFSQFGPFELSSASALRNEREAKAAREMERSDGSRSRNKNSRFPKSTPQLNEEYYLSAALAEEGSRPSLAFIFPPLARAIEDAAKEAQSPSNKPRKAFGRAHLHVVENEDHERGGRSDPFEIVAPDRNYDCQNYDTCLGLAAALNWNSFACTGCSGSVNQHLLWRAHSEVRKNKTLAELCDLPNISPHVVEGGTDSGESDTPSVNTVTIDGDAADEIEEFDQPER